MDIDCEQYEYNDRFSHESSESIIVIVITIILEQHAKTNRFNNGQLSVNAQNLSYLSLFC